MYTAQPEGVNLAELILGEGLRRVEEDRPPARLAERVLEGRDLITKRFPTSRRRRHHNVLTSPNPLVSLELVRVQPGGTHLTQRLRELGPELGQLHEVRLTRWEARNRIPQRLDRATAHRGQGALDLRFSHGSSAKLSAQTKKAEA